MPTTFSQQLLKVRDSPGLIAALDQSGGSTPRALALYGIDSAAYSTDAEMFALMHAMRCRIMTSSCFDGTRIVGAILFQHTLSGTVGGRPTSDYLWSVKNIVPFLKVDSGLAAESDGVQLMAPIADLDALLAEAVRQHVFGTKMRSVIKLASRAGIDAIVRQQFAVGSQILASGLIPIIEPEIDIDCPDKASAELLLREALWNSLDALADSAHVILKLTLPEKPDFYHSLTNHPRVLRIVALSGGYPRRDANRRLAANRAVIASFSRALTEDLRVSQTDAEFAAALEEAISTTYAASAT